jgi:cysteine synthase A
MTALTRLELDASIGNTPLVNVGVKVAGRNHTLLLKLESYNGGGGSIKARTVRGLLDRAAAEGRLSPCGRVIESSSGNFAAALAIQGRARGLEVTVVLDPKVTDANLAKVRALGAAVEIVADADEHGGYLLARLARVRRMLAEDPESYWTNQYGSPANPEAHYYGTGLEIVLASPDADAIMVPCSTGGTVAGIAARVRASGLNIQVIPVDIPGSYALRAGCGDRYLTGIGSARSSSFLSAEDRRGALIVEDGFAIAACRALERQAGISVGGSSGAAVVAALRWLVGRPSGRRVVVVCPDGGAGYDFSDAGIRRLGIECLPPLPLALDDTDLAVARTRPLTSAKTF